MADRTVSVNLRANVKGFSEGMAQASKDTQTLSRRMTETGSTAEEMRRRLEAATRKLPKIEIDADSSAAELEFAKLRRELESLASKKIGVDIDSGEALHRLREIEQGLNQLSAMEADPLVSADIDEALADLRHVDTALDRIDGRTAIAKVEVDTGSALPKLADFAEAAGGALAAGMRTAGPALGGALAGALGGAALAVGPAVGAAAGGAIVAGIGAKLAILGTESLFYVQEIDKSWSAAEKRRVEAANKQAKELQAQFRELGRDLALAMQEAAEPMRSVLDEVRVQARGLAKDVGPDLAAGFAQARVPMEQFVRELGAGLKELGDSIPSLMGGFGDVISQIDIKGFLSDLGDALDDLGRVVSENRSTIGAVLNGLMDAIPLAIGGIGKVIEFFGKMGLAVMRSASVISEHMASVTGVITGVGKRVLDMIRTIGETLSNVPGAEELGRRIVEGADAGIKKLEEFQKTADDASKAVRLKADIIELQQGIDKALTLLDDPNLSKERRAQISAEIDRLMRAKSEAIVQLGDPKLVAEYKSSLTSDISALQSRLADARKELKDPELTKERKSKLNAEISQLKDAVARAKESLNTLQDKTVRVFVKTEYQDDLSRQALRDANRRAAGGIDRYAAGGIDYAAAGGMRLRPQPPQVVSRPTVLFGEGSSGSGATEAFIPYESRFRPRAVQLLGQVADDFGLGLYNRQAATTISAVGDSVQVSGREVSAATAAAMGTLDATLGQAGSLTSSINQVGTVGQSLVTGWTTGSQVIGDAVSETGGIVSAGVTDISGSIDGLANSIDSLTSAVDGLSSSLSSAKQATSSSSSTGRRDRGSGSRQKGGAGYLLEETKGSTGRHSLKETKGSIGYSLKETKGAIKNPGGMIAGSLPALAAGGIITRPTLALVGEAGREAVVPLDGPRGRAMLSGPVNSSRVSRPQQAPAGSYMPAANAGTAQTTGSWGGSGGGASAPAVVVQEQNIYQDADADRFAAQAAMRVRGRGR